jgi:ketosteroid isomerase-like protein
MSQQNVEIVRRVNEAFAARDIDAYLAEHSPNVEVVVLRSQIEGPYHGHRGLRRLLTDAFEADMELQFDEVRDYGDRVLVLGHQHATVLGVPFDHILAELFEIEAGKVVRMRAFKTVEQALEAVGHVDGHGGAP